MRMRPGPSTFGTTGGGPRRAVPAPSRETCTVEYTAILKSWQRLMYTYVAEYKQTWIVQKRQW